MGKADEAMCEVIFGAIKECAPRIYKLIQEGSAEYSKTTNATGDQQLKVDVKADELIQEAFSKIPAIKGICSEEQEGIVPLNPEGRYMIAYDPLDGSSLMGVNMSVGSIFGIYEEKFGAKYLCAAAYLIYGLGIELIIAKERVKHYRFRSGGFEYCGDLVLKDRGNINATGATQKYWSSKHRALIDSLFDEGYRLRYSGGMVPDLHHILIKGGGLFSYPATKDHPRGKLRMLFEVLPFAFIFEKAHGAAIDGKNRLLEQEHTHLHETIPCFFGSKEEIERVRSTYQES